MLVLRQELIKTQTLMDALNQDHDKEREHLTSELSDVRQKLQLYVLILELTLESPFSAVLAVAKSETGFHPVCFRIIQVTNQ